ncbi:cyclic nucleotide-binding domain-containing protein, partial [Candidatus Gottesmanbacteria bacterium]|nr:cyclic nucleotide-binding domain-containing protein [Candidatus Gottesmanbacteria bacterium]
MKQQRTNAVVGKKIADFFFSGAKRSFQKGSIILRPGESISSIFFIQSGYVRIVHHTKKGDAVTLHLFRPGCFFPLINLFNGKPSQYTIEALSPVTVYEKSSMHVREYLHLHPDVLFDVTARLLSGIEGLLLRVTL